MEFARISGDFSPLHTDPQFARHSRYRGVVAHGMFSAVLLLSLREEEFVPSHIQFDFLAPVVADETIEFQCTDGQNLNWRTFRKSDNKETLFAQFGNPCPMEKNQIPVECDAFRPKLHLNDLSLNILVGKKESVQFSADEKRIQQLNTLLTQMGSLPLSDQAASFSLFLGGISALVGMRLPGKNATFLDFEWTGTENPGSTPVRIDLSVDEVLPGSQRAIIKVEVFRDNRIMGHGSITAMVQASETRNSSCEDLKSSVLPLAFSGKTAWVVGASRGIGNTTAKLLALSGAKVVLQYYQGKEEAEESVKDILSHGGIAMAVQGDIRKNEQMALIGEKIQENFGGVDIFISTAVDSVIAEDPLSLSSSQILNELKTTVLGLHDSLQVVIPQMRKRGGGKIILLSSIYTDVPEKGQLKYITAKSALTGYVRSLALELSGDKIQVNLVVPAVTETSLLSAVPQGLLDRMRSESIEGRFLSTVEVSNTILFFASSLSNAVSGQRLVVNRGQAPFL